MDTCKIKAIIGRADLHVNGTVTRSEGGLPIGNGVMGTLVWTSPHALKTQINRVDLFANDSYSNSFNERHLDYGYACAFVDVELAGFSDDVFGKDTKQHLRLYNADGMIAGNGVSSSFFACEGMDVMVFSVDDTREGCDGAAVRLKMLRPSEVQTKSHLAVSKFIIKNDVIILKQEFTEGDFYAASAVAVKVTGKAGRVRLSNESGTDAPGIPGRAPIVLGKENETEIRLCLAPGAGNFDVFVSSAVSYSRDVDPVEKAVDLVNRAANTGKAQLKTEQERVWADYWSKSYIELWGNDDCRLVETHYNYYMYIMGACSRNGAYAPNFGGMLFSTRGDLRHWGTMQWWNNLMLYYNAIMASGRYEIAMPFFTQWNNMRDRLEIAAKQQWDSKGIYIPEVVGFDGPEVLSDELATELADLMLMRKPWEERSEAFRAFALKKRPHESRWNFFAQEEWDNGTLVQKDRDMGPFGPVTHMLGSQSGIAFLYWEYYLFSGDSGYLRDYAYPIIKGVAEFFNHFPNLKKGEDGKYHAWHTNCSEGFYGSTNSNETMGAMYGIFPMAIKASEILGIDDNLRQEWAEKLANLAPLPTTADNRWLDAINSDKVDVSEVKVHKRGGNPTLCRMYDLCTLETEYVNPALYASGKNTVDYIIANNAITSRRFVYEMSGMGRIIANMGHGEELGDLLVGQINCINAADEYCYYHNNGRAPQYENRLTSREGINAMSAQRLGNVASALQLGLLQSNGGSPTGDPVIRLFPAFPSKWNARFALHAKGGFKVEACREDGILGEVKITSLLGNTLRVRGLAGRKVTLNGKDAGVADELLVLDTAKGDIVAL